MSVSIECESPLIISLEFEGQSYMGTLRHGDALMAAEIIKQDAIHIAREGDSIIVSAGDSNRDARADFVCRKTLDNNELREAILKTKQESREAILKTNQELREAIQKIKQELREAIQKTKQESREGDNRIISALRSRSDDRFIPSGAIASAIEAIYARPWETLTDCENATKELDEIRGEISGFAEDIDSAINGSLAEIKSAISNGL